MSIKALGASLSIFHETGIDKIKEQIFKLGNTILEELNRRKFHILSSTEAEERSGIISFTGQFDVHKLHTHMLKHDVSITVRDGLVRLSPHFYNNENEIMRFFNLLDFFIKTH